MKPAGVHAYFARIAPDLEHAEARLAERGSSLGRPLHLRSVTGSTNDDAKAGARQGAAHGTTWVAEQQTSGRGRRGRPWVSPPGEGLLFSTLLRVACPTSHLPRIALLAGLAVRDAVACAAPGARPRIKWPNDVVVDGRKLAGILVEASTTAQPAGALQAVIVGIGMNVHTREFPEDIAGRATSVALIAPDRPADRASLLVDTLERLDADLAPVLARGLGLVRARIQAADDLLGREVKSEAGAEGTACGIDDDGCLLVRTGRGITARWSSGEVMLAKV